MSQPGKNWMPSMHMPTTGVVRPQPTSSNYSNSVPQTAFNLNTSVYPMPNLQHHHVGTVQHGTIKPREFVQMNGNSLIQQKLIEDHRKLRQFNEQKEKFCGFSAKGTGHASNSIGQNYTNSSKGSGQNVPSAEPITNSNRKGHTRQPLPLPAWLTDPLRLPSVYQKAGGLVDSQDGFVDTSRAYMLLMRTGIQPALLGVMWEMVNRTRPGCLKLEEFYGLLALVALIQNGQAVPSADYLASIEHPICPVIDHPVLAVKPDSSVAGKEVCASVVKTSESEDLDDFDDFVSAPTVSPLHIAEEAPRKVVNTAVSLPVSSTPSVAHGGKPILETSFSNDILIGGIDNSLQPSTSIANITSLSNIMPSTVATGATATSTSGTASREHPLGDTFVSSAPTQLTLNPLDSVNFSKRKLPPELSSITTCKGKADRINLPILGPSPKHGTPDDDFADFQSNVPEISSRSADKSALFSTDDQPMDKYAILRGIVPVDQHRPKEKSTANCIDGASEFDADFGQFHSAQKSTPSMGFQSSVPPPPGAETNLPLFEADLQRTYSTDPFGEFDDANSLDKPMSLANMTVSSKPKEIVQNEDDFGDFVSSDMPTKSSSSLDKTLNLTVTETITDTQSVASLELPDLDATINLCSSYLFPAETASNETAVQSTERSSPQKGNLETTSLDVEDIFNLSAAQHQTIQSLPTSTMQRPIPVTDKYSIIRDNHGQVEHADPRSDTWMKCLTGCNKLLSEGSALLEKIATENGLIRDVLATSQMREYLSNLNEVWRVCVRIMCSTRKTATSSKIEDLLADNQLLWTSIISISECQFDKANDKDGLADEHKTCNVCLCEGSVNLSYGGQNYHAPCANLWLNAVDVILPAVRVPVTSIL